MVSPVMLVIAFIAGVAAAFTVMYRWALADQKENLAPRPSGRKHVDTARGGGTTYLSVIHESMPMKDLLDMVFQRMGEWLKEQEHSQEVARGEYELVVTWEATLYKTTPPVPPRDRA